MRLWRTPKGMDPRSYWSGFWGAFVGMAVGQFIGSVVWHWWHS